MIAPLNNPPEPSSSLYELKITLRGSKPAIWRRLQVPGRIKLNRLHQVLQAAMGWTDSHLHQFIDPPVVYSVPSGEDYPGPIAGVFQAAHFGGLIPVVQRGGTYEAVHTRNRFCDAYSS